jgi:hypothetical protein
MMARKGESSMTLPRAVGAATLLSIPFAADKAYQRGDTVAPLARAQATGENLMTDPFTSFVQKRSAEKTAGFGQHAARATGGMMGAAGKTMEDIMSRLLRVGGKADEAVSMARVGAVGGAGLLAGSGLDVLQGKDSVGSGLEYQLSKSFIPIEDRIQATDTAATSFLSQGGKNMANLLDEAIREGVNTGFGAATQHNRSFNQDLQFQAAMNSDPLLRGATKQTWRRTNLL